MPNQLPSDLTLVALRLFEGLDTSLSLKLAIMLRYGDWDGIADVSPDPRAYYDDVSLYARDSAAAGFLRKFEPLPTTLDRRKKALEKWWEGERDCHLSNIRLEPYLEENLLFQQWDGTPEGRIRGVLQRIRRKIESWIGRAPPDLLVGRFGPGSTFLVKSGRTTVPDKMSIAPSLTRGAIYFLPQWLGSQWGSAIAANHGELSFVPGNRFATVPKTSKIMRAIAAEPDINVFYQLALGKELRSRLREETGWDLDTAQEIHRQVAEVSSVDKRFATLDLSNASDTVCRTLVKILIPHLWHDQLDGLRSPKTLVDGRWVMLEKFSSMGNGFTFELETIIFAAISCVVSEEILGYEALLGFDVYTFGDDIIVRDEVFKPLKSVLEFLGFRLNEEKSFSGDDNFRESCGADFFLGKPVRPFFLKESVDGPQDMVSLANGISALFDRLALAGVAVNRRAWFTVLDHIPTRVRSCRGPKSLGDIVIHDDEVRWTFRVRNSIRYLRALKPSRWRRVSFESFSPEVILASATYGVSTSDRRGWTFSATGGLIPRDGVLAYNVGWVPFS